MKNLLGGFVVFFGLAGAAALDGCGDSGGSEESGTWASALASCVAYCDTLIAAACVPAPFTSDGLCKASECTPIPTMASVDCYTVTKTYFECRRTQSDICGDTGCTDQAAAVLSGCP